MDKTLLLLGDENDYDSYNKICQQLEQHPPRRLNAVIATYDQLDSNRLPSFRVKRLSSTYVSPSDTGITTSNMNRTEACMATWVLQ